MPVEQQAVGHLPAAPVRFFDTAQEHAGECWFQRLLCLPESLNNVLATTVQIVPPGLVQDLDSLFALHGFSVPANARVVAALARQLVRGVAPFLTVQRGRGDLPWVPHITHQPLHGIPNVSLRP